MVEGENPTPLEEQELLKEEVRLKTEDDYYAEWALESIKSSINLANDVLRQLLTLSTSLIGGSVVLTESKLLYPPHLRFIVIVFFIAGLVYAFMGVIPYEHTYIRDIKEFKRAKVSALATKQKHINKSASCIFMGIIAALALLEINEIHNSFN